MYNKQSLTILQKALDKLSEGFSHLPSFEQEIPDDVEKILLEVAERMQNNFPYHHPLYAGQMLKPPHEVARLAYMLSMWINPNNHALDGGRESSAMEKETVAEIALMFGWQECLAHLTSSGTFANLEALWVAGNIHPKKRIVASELAHYTHERISHVLGLKFQKIACDKSGKMDLKKLEAQLKKGTIGTVVVTMGTTGIGSVDPLPEILELQKKYQFRIHLDAAYGGYFRLADNLPEDTLKKYALMQEADSIVVDPHKHGLQPYGCGCILFKNPEVGKFYKHDSPYTYFSSAELHLGEISLECSRAGAAAVGLWATQKLFPLVKGGAFSKKINSSHNAAMMLYKKIISDKRFIILQEPEIDIVIWALKEKTISAVNRKSKAIFEKAAEKNLHLALLNYPVRLLPTHWRSITKDEEYVTCLRSCLLKPEHENWIEDIWKIVTESLS
ncbi:MAG: aspartate aminotransferase family protein [Bacteroidetes bacterium]|nr:aspartate aminotransferase family protein [Bacteroidota bacterium]